MFIACIVQHGTLGKTVARGSFNEAVEAGIALHREHAEIPLVVGKIREELEDQNFVTLGGNKGTVCIGMVDEDDTQ